MHVVIDTNVVVAAVFWPGDPRKCLVAWAKRQYHLAVTLPIFEEYCDISRRLVLRYPDVNPEPWLKWIEAKAKVYEPAQLGRQRSVDPEDDAFLACALASGAKHIISRDHHLLDLGKPFGVEILLPSQFLQRFS